ncbi:MAG: hypothetical protein R2873_28740 [Caldilineaceae bacterium]
MSLLASRQYTVQHNSEVGVISDDLPRKRTDALPRKRRATQLVCIRPCEPLDTGLAVVGAACSSQILVKQRISARGAGGLRLLIMQLRGSVATHIALGLGLIAPPTGAACLPCL